MTSVDELERRVRRLERELAALLARIEDAARILKRSDDAQVQQAARRLD